MIRLSSIRDSFEGVIPSVIATMDASGQPNISYLSHIYYIDERHVALSNQFFSKTSENIRNSNRASAMVVSGRTGVQHILDITFKESLQAGPLFDRLSAHLKAMGHAAGMEEVMRLRAIDIFHVEDCRLVTPVAPLELPDPAKEDPGCDHLSRAALIVRDIGAELDPERMFDTALEGLNQRFGYPYALVSIPNEDEQKLVTIASMGYRDYGFGSEIPFGEGAIGVAAVARQPVRISDFSRGLRYVTAVQATAGSTPDAVIPLPLLIAPLSQLAVPMLVRGRLMGVLFVESERNFAFDYRDEEALTIIATQLATGLLLAERDSHDGEPAVVPPSPPEIERPASRFLVRYFSHDGSLFIDDDYVIRGVPGRLLHHFLECYLAHGQQDFSNREIRRNRAIALPDFKDNLETRLILLKRRLDEKGGPIRIERPERGRIRLEIRGVPQIDVVQS